MLNRPHVASDVFVLLGAGLQVWDSPLEAVETHGSKRGDRISAAMWPAEDMG